MAHAAGEYNNPHHTEVPETNNNTGEMASDDIPKGTPVGTGICSTVGAGVGGAVGSLLGAEWAPPVAAFGATVGGKTAEWVFPSGCNVNADGTLLRNIAAFSLVGVVGTIFGTQVAVGAAFGGGVGYLLKGALSGHYDRETMNNRANDILGGSIYVLQMIRNVWPGPARS